MSIGNSSFHTLSSVRHRLLLVGLHFLDFCLICIGCVSLWSELPFLECTGGQKFPKARADMVALPTWGAGGTLALCARSAQEHLSS